MKKNRCLQTFIKDLQKACIKFKKSWQKIIFTFTLVLICAACGSTKVSVDRPAAGTSTTITVTTNNPITTEVKTNAELKNN